METEQQIAIWAQRHLRGKLHLPFFTADVKHHVDGQVDYLASLDTITQRPLCGRQLNNHRAERSQQSDRIEFATGLGEFTYQLMSRRACSHCATRAGLLVRTITTREGDSDDDDSAEG